MPSKTTLFCTGFLSGVLVTLLALSWGGGKIIPSGSVRPQSPAIQMPALALPVLMNEQELKDSPSLGDQNAPVTLVEYADFHCPFCGRVEATIQRLVDENPGKVRRVWKHFPLPFHQGAEITHQASECAREQGRFWEFHKAVFSNPENLRNPDFHSQFAKEQGLNQEQFLNCISSGKYQAKVKQDLEEGGRKGVEGTPATFVNGQLVSGAVPFERFKAYVDHFLNPGTVPLPQSPEQARSTEKPVIVQFDDLQGKPSLGPDNAPVTLVEFSDFHCPFCHKVVPTLDQLMKNFDGKIRRVFRHYPLPFHAGADKTHQASECAHEQGKFWEFAHKVYENQDKLQDPNILNQIADQIGLDKGKFESCVTSGKYKETVEKDIQKAGQSGVQGTPTVFVNGEIVVGARPYEHFESVVKSKLEKS